MMFWYVLAGILVFFWVILPLTVLGVIAAMWIRKRLSTHQPSVAADKEQLSDVGASLVDRA